MNEAWHLKIRVAGSEGSYDVCIHICIYTYSCSNCIMFVFQGGLVFQVLFFTRGVCMCSIVSVIPEQMTVAVRVATCRQGVVRTNQLVVPNYRSGIYINASNCFFLVVDCWFKLEKWWCGRVPWSPLGFSSDWSDVKNPLIQKGLKQMCSGERWDCCEKPGNEQKLLMCTQMLSQHVIINPTNPLGGLNVPS